MGDRSVIVGNSDGIGLALTRALLERGWTVRGLSRSPSQVEHASYQHTIVDVREREFLDALERALEAGDTHLVIYCAGIGEPFHPSRLADDIATFETNLMGFVRTVERSLPHLLSRKSGTLVGLSSMIDVLRSKASPAYGASKAGMSRYAESIGLAIRDTGVKVVNVRLGFVNTKMAKADFKPWLLQPEEVADRILRRVLTASPPRRLNIPRRMAALTVLAQFFVGRL
ncbi:MAG: SDR family NAD(P)-dependent oxidoreductase [Gemmatimonadales bacterium]|nr:SDR family NAD(P)-dependent oxidoreductase [Gemmatimonadales bacterium]